MHTFEKYNRRLMMSSHLRKTLAAVLIILGIWIAGADANNSTDGTEFRADGPNASQAYSALLSKARSSGRVRIIARLGTPFVPEGLLSEPLGGLNQQGRISGMQDQLLNTLPGYDVRGVKRFRYIPFISMDVDPAALAQLMSSPLVTQIEEDVPVPPTLNDSIPLINANDVWTSGYTGSGWAVAILDTGVEKTHSFFSGNKVVSEACFSTTGASATTLCPNGLDSQTGSGSGVNCSVSVSGCDHGTHVAGIAAGKSASVNGVAKDADIIAVQVFSSFASSADCGSLPAPCALSYTSDQMQALEHIYSLRTTYNIASVNMSLGGGSYAANCDSDSRKAAIDNLRAAGIATIIASGNEGYCGSIGAPACISSAVSVGATTKTDAEASYDNYASILSLFAPGSSIYSSVPGGWGYKSGTSMATPHVTGAWAVLKQAVPSASVTDILNALKGTGVSVPDACYGGAGNYTQKRIDLLAALDTFGIALPFVWSDHFNNYTFDDNWTYEAVNASGTIAESGTMLSLNIAKPVSGCSEVYLLGKDRFRAQDIVFEIGFKPSKTGNMSFNINQSVADSIHADFYYASGLPKIVFGKVEGGAASGQTYDGSEINIKKKYKNKTMKIVKRSDNFELYVNELKKGDMLEQLALEDADLQIRIDSSTCYPYGYKAQIDYVFASTPEHSGLPAGQLRLIAPNGGETVRTGSFYLVEWEAPASVPYFMIEYSVDNGTKWKLIESGIQGTNYVWKLVKEKPFSSYLLRVRGHDVSGIPDGTSDISDAPFAVTY